MIVLLLLGFSLIVAFELPMLVRKRMWRELSAFAVLLAVGFMLSIVQVLGIELSDLTRAIESVFKKLL
ncbi:MAG: hypothetical protein PWP21_759 [Thermosediminibacterales bacterium]|nr:hypothetical protein [Thermosediminibacterales bacterium]